MSTRALVTNEQIAKDLNITHSMVSRVRSGDRTPSLETMLTIHEVFKWGLEQQALARAMGRYATEFETALARHYGR